jgi:hypothetical protein
MNIFALVAILLASVCGLAAPSQATVVDQVVAADGIFGPFNGSINQGATGSNAILTWSYPVEGQPFTLDFTNASNVITDVMFSLGYAGASLDDLEFDGYLSGNAAIGTTCVAGGDVGCLQATGTTQDVTAAVAGLVRFGCCGDSLTVVVDDGVAVATPEPAPITVFGTAVAGLVLLRRRRRA